MKAYIPLRKNLTTGREWLDTESADCVKSLVERTLAERDNHTRRAREFSTTNPVVRIIETHWPENVYNVFELGKGTGYPRGYGSSLEPDYEHFGPGVRVY